MGIFFSWSSASSSGGSVFVALAGNLGDDFFVSSVGGCLPSWPEFWPRHVTGVTAAAKTAVNTSARSTVARIIAFPFNLKEHLLSQNRTAMETETEFEREAFWSRPLGPPAVTSLLPAPKYKGTGRA